MRGLADKDTRLALLKDIAIAFGYAGEDGRDRKYLVRANEILQSIVEELEPFKEADKKLEFANALEERASSLGRLAPGAIDNLLATREAIEAGESAIAYRSRYFPDYPSWSTHINLATSQLEMFELDDVDVWIERSVVNARRALTIISEANLDGREMMQYVRGRLGEILAIRAHNGKSLSDEERSALFAEARAYLDEAEPLFREMNAQAYLRFVNKARLLFPKADESH